MISDLYHKPGFFRLFVYVDKANLILMVNESRNIPKKKKVDISRNQFEKFNTMRMNKMSHQNYTIDLSFVWNDAVIKGKIYDQQTI